jgi:hypothetical protein
VEKIKRYELALKNWVPCVKGKLEGSGAMHRVAIKLEQGPNVNGLSATVKTKQSCHRWINKVV